MKAKFLTKLNDKNYQLKLLSRVTKVGDLSGELDVSAAPAIPTLPSDHRITNFVNLCGKLICMRADIFSLLYLQNVGT